MKLKTLLLMLFISSFLAACYNDKLEDLHPKLNKSCDSTAISYAKQITVVMNNDCVGCHNSNNKGGGVNLDNYADVKAQGVTGKLLSSVIFLSKYKSMEIPRKYENQKTIFIVFSFRE